MAVEPIADRFAAFGWDAREVDGHDIPALLAAFAALPPTTSRAAAGARSRTPSRARASATWSRRATWHLGYLGARRRGRDAGRDRRPTMAERAAARAPVRRAPRAGTWRRSSRLATAAVVGRGAGADLADDRRPRSWSLTADLMYSNRTDPFAARHPDRFFNVGIAEQHMVSMAAGLATFGYVPYVGDVRELRRPAVRRADPHRPRLPGAAGAHPRRTTPGISLGFYGTSHHATEDLGAHALDRRPDGGLPVRRDRRRRGCCGDASTCPGPVYLRLGRGREPDVYAAGSPAIELGRATVLRDGDDLDDRRERHHGRAPRWRRPSALAADGVARGGARRPHGPPVRRRDHLPLRRSAPGGCWSPRSTTSSAASATACADALVDSGVGAVLLHRAGLPADEYSLIGPPTHLYRHYQLDAEGLVARARALVQTPLRDGRNP